MNPKSFHQESRAEGIKDKLIISGASESFSPSLLALLGSLTLNWPEHPPVLVYDLGMNEETLATLHENHIDVRKVPPFVPHWRKHFTWKVWCWNDAPARDVLWLDSGVVVLQPINDVFEAIYRLGYFINPTYYLLNDTATEAACIGCGIDVGFRNGKMTFNGGVVGFRKEGIIGDMIQKALEIASVEEYIKSTIPLGRHDQAILSLLIHKYIPNPIMLDTMIYAGWESPQQVHGQKVWQHRRNLRQEDIEHFKRHISTPGTSYLPGIPPKPKMENIMTRARRILNKSPRELMQSIQRRFSNKAPEREIYDGIRD
ncbi:MAG: hypothetical protein ABIJ39_01400 [Chloroflexota bacterium]